MRWFRRKPDNGLLEDERPDMSEAIGATVVDDVDVLNARFTALDARLAALEARLADADEAAVVLPDQGDVLDAQLRSARLSAELHLVAIELRAELQRLQAAPADDERDSTELADRLADLTADR
jgi:hypothetical protein